MKITFIWRVYFKRTERVDQTASIIVYVCLQFIIR